MKANLTHVSTIFVPHKDRDRTNGILNQRAGASGEVFLEYLLFHPALIQGVTIFADPSVLNKDDACFLVYTAREFDPALLTALNKGLEGSPLSFKQTWPLTLHSLVRPTEQSAAVNLLGSSLNLRLKLEPAASGEGFTLSMGNLIPISLVTKLQNALFACRLLGHDGRSPILDLRISILAAEWSSEDIFALRQSATLHKAVRACFLKALEAGETKPFG